MISWIHFRDLINSPWISLFRFIITNRDILITNNKKTYEFQVNRFYQNHANNSATTRSLPRASYNGSPRLLFALVWYVDLISSVSLPSKNKVSVMSCNRWFDARTLVLSSLRFTHYATPSNPHSRTSSQLVAVH